MPYFIIISGPLGVGKTTIAKRLSKILTAEYFPIDVVLHNNDLDKVNKDSEGISLANFLKADELILPKIVESLKNDKTVILDACFYHKAHIEHLVNSLQYPNYVFSLKAPLETCIKRDGKRKKSYGQDAAAAVYTLVSRFEYGISIDTKDKNTDQIINEVLSYLKPNH